MSITDLFDAINDNDVEEVKNLLQNHQFNLEERDELGDTPLLKACIGENIEIVTELINRGANVNVVNTCFPFESTSPIDTAIEHKNHQLLELLVSTGGILPNKVDEAMNFEIALILYTHKVEFDNCCLINSIIDECDFATVRILTDIGVDLNYIDSFGKNALHYACECNPNPSIIQTLINHGINTELINNNGKKPIDLLQNNSDEDDLCKKIINREINIYVDEMPTILTNDEFMRMFKGNNA